MSVENLELGRRLVEGFNRGGLAAVEDLFDPDIVMDQSHSPFPDAGVYRGIEGIRRWFDGIAAAFGEVHYDIVEMRDLGDRVAAVLHVHGRGPGSGIEVDYRFLPVLTIREGKITRIDRFTHWDEVEAGHGTSQSPA